MTHIFSDLKFITILQCNNHNIHDLNLDLNPIAKAKGEIQDGFTRADICYISLFGKLILPTISQIAAEVTAFAVSHHRKRLPFQETRLIKTTPCVHRRPTIGIMAHFCIAVVLVNSMTL